MFAHMHPANKDSSALENLPFFPDVSTLVQTVTSTISAKNNSVSLAPQIASILALPSTTTYSKSSSMPTRQSFPLPFSLQSSDTADSKKTISPALISCAVILAIVFLIAIIAISLVLVYRRRYHLLQKEPMHVPSEVPDVESERHSVMMDSPGSFDIVSMSNPDVEDEITSRATTFASPMSSSQRIRLFAANRFSRNVQSSITAETHSMHALAPTPLSQNKDRPVSEETQSDCRPLPVREWEPAPQLPPLSLEGLNLRFRTESEEDYTTWLRARKGVRNSNPGLRANSVDRLSPDGQKREKPVRRSGSAGDARYHFYLCFFTML